MKTGYLQKLIKHNSITRVTTLNSDQPNRKVDILFIHRDTGKYFLATSQDFVKYVKNFKSYCKNVKGINEGVDFKQFARTTEYSDWDIFLATRSFTNPFSLSFLESQLGLKPFTKIQSSNKEDKKRKAVLYKIDSVPLTVTRYYLTGRELTESEILSNVKLNFKEIGHTSRAMKKQTELNPNFHKLREAFLNSENFKITEVPAEEAHRLSKYGYTTTTITINRIAMMNIRDGEV